MVPTPRGITPANPMMQYHKQEGLLGDRVDFSHFLWWDSRLYRVKDTPDNFFYHQNIKSWYKVHTRYILCV